MFNQCRAILLSSCFATTLHFFNKNAGIGDSAVVIKRFGLVEKKRPSGFRRALSAIFDP
jgi:hypothetical protein